MTPLLTFLLLLLVLGLILVILMALVSPFEALGWWAGWSKRQLMPSQPIQVNELNAKTADLYIVYLTAIGGISAEEISTRERRFLNRIEDSLTTDSIIIDDVFPFSVSNNPLNGERALGWLWQRIHNSRMGGKGSALAGLIFVRNLFQVGVSGDPRYGPIYNVGVAREIARSLLRHGYPVSSGKPIAVIGWSGGGQIAIGVVPYLHEALEAPIYVVSVGGVMSSDPGISQVEALFHFQGSKDKFPNIGELLYPGRWPIIKYSAWNQAKRNNKIKVIPTGPMRHTGKGDYFDRHSKLPDGQSYLDKTVGLIAAELINISN